MNRDDNDRETLSLLEIERFALEGETGPPRRRSASRPVHVAARPATPTAPSGRAIRRTARRGGRLVPLLLVIAVAGLVAAAVVFLGPQRNETQNVGVITLAYGDQDGGTGSGIAPEITYNDVVAGTVNAWDVRISKNTYISERLVDVDLYVTGATCDQLDVFAGTAPGPTSTITGTTVGGDCDFGAISLAQTVAAGAVGATWYFAHVYSTDNPPLGTLDFGVQAVAG